MQIGMIGLGRMGANMVRRLTKGGHECVVFDVQAKSVEALAKEGAKPSKSLEDMVQQLAKPRKLWLMLPVAFVDSTLDNLIPLLDKDDVIIDGGNSYYHDDIRRSKALKEKSLHYMDVGVSGGIWGAERGYCLMIGGDKTAYDRLEPIFSCLAPGVGTTPRTPGCKGEVSAAENGYLHCGESGAGHFVKMVHNGIEYGLMAAFAEGLNILRHANAGKTQRDNDAETTPLRNPEHYQYDLDLAKITEVWRRGSVIGSWLLDLTASALHESPDLSEYAGRVSDSGEGRWTMIAAIDEGVPAPILNSALTSRFSSRGDEEFGNKMLSALRHQFGGHVEKAK